MTTPPRIVLDQQEHAEAQRRLVHYANLAIIEAQRRKRLIRVVRVLIAVGVAVAVVVAFVLGVLVVSGI